jgi:hypothetical protein
MATESTRREFAKFAAGTMTALSASRVMGANNRIRMGLIGCGNRGSPIWSIFLKQPEVEPVAVCDVYTPYRDTWKEKSGSKDLADLVKQDANYLATQYFISPPTYSKGLKRLIDKRAEIIKRIDPELFKQEVYGNLVERTSELLHETPFLKKQYEKLIERGMISQSDIDQARAFAKTLDYSKLKSIVKNLE